MKNYLKIGMGIIALGFLIVIVKENFFKTNDDRLYELGWDNYEKQNYEGAILNFTQVNEDKYPDVNSLIGSAYLKKGNNNKAIVFLEKAYNDSRLKNTEEYTKIIVSLAMAHIYEKNLKKGESLLLEAEALGYNIRENREILDSIYKKK